MSAIEIRELSIPASADAPGAAEFFAAMDLRNETEAEGYSSREMDESHAESIADWGDQEYEPKRLFVAELDGELAGFGKYETRSSDDSMAWLFEGVAPGFRRRGVGSAIADHLEATARADGRAAVIAYTVSAPGSGERLPSPTGFGSVPAGNPEVLFLRGRGYALEQVLRASRLALPLAVDIPPAPAGYRLVRWTGATPPEWLDDVAMLYTRMSTDAPTAGLDEPEDPWDAQRVISLEDRVADDGRTLHLSAVEHGGHLVGMSQLATPPEPGRPAVQWETIVLAEHRGRGLGMLLKA
ncbi:MAG: GNAT family N-acetyltransferase, partial [Actinomycetota bacterium]